MQGRPQADFQHPRIAEVHRDRQLFLAGMSICLGLDLGIGINLGLSLSRGLSLGLSLSFIGLWLSITLY